MRKTKAKKTHRYHNNVFGKKILIADDDPAICESISMILSDAGYRVEATTDGNALTKLKNNLPDLILLDLWMSGSDGREICLYLKNNEKTKHVPIIIFSANKDLQTIAQEYKADGYLEKPFEMENLLKIVSQQLKTFKLHEF